MNILIADDSKAMRTILKRALRQAGYAHAEITEASNGREAALAVQRQVPHVVLTDWNMPDVSGHELLMWLEKSGYRGATGVVSSAATPEMRAQAKAAGAKFIIVKPFGPEDFKEALESAGFQSQNAQTDAEGGTRHALGLSVDGLQTSLGGAYRPEVKVTNASSKIAGDAFVVATYQSGEEIVGHVSLNRELALILGAALMLIPVGVVKESLRGPVPANIGANIAEVFNLLVRLFKQGDGGVIRVAHIDLEARKPATERFGRLDATVTVAGYGSGPLALSW